MTKFFNFIVKVETIAVPDGRARGQLPPSLQNFGKIKIFWAATRKIFGQNQNFSGSDTKKIGQIQEI